MYKTPNGKVVPAMGMVWVDFTDLTNGFVRLMAEADDEHQISTYLTAKQAETLASVLRNGNYPLDACIRSGRDANAGGAV